MIKIITSRIDSQELAELCRAHFKTMVKFVVDIERGEMALGGELHADAEALLLAQGSRQSDLWGGNFYPWNAPEERVEFTSFINIRPADDNASMEILDEGARRRVIRLVQELLLSPEENIPGAPQ